MESFSLYGQISSVCNQSLVGNSVWLGACRGTNRWQNGIVLKWLELGKIYLPLQLQSVRIQHVFRAFISTETKRALVCSFRTGGSKCIILVCAGLARERLSMWSQNRSSELYATDSDIVEMPAQTLSTNVCFAVWAADFPSFSSEPDLYTQRNRAHKYWY